MKIERSLDDCYLAKVKRKGGRKRKRKGRSLPPEGEEKKQKCELTPLIARSTAPRQFHKEKKKEALTE